MTGRRLSVRDYKRPRRDGLSSGWLRPFALGLALGLALAAAVFIETRHHFMVSAAASTLIAPNAGQPAHAARGAGARRGDADTQAAATTPTDGSTAPGGVSHSAGSGASGGSATATTAGTALPKFDFYQMLPRSQVLIPAHESEAHLSPGAPLDRPGTYFLQIGSYRDGAVADRVRAQVQKLGVAVSVQRIVVNTVTWHRVRVGPIRDLTVLNRVRHQLQAGNLAAMLVRVNP
ncbi:MAG TPA: SPOR domain-containing protein [Steroidobacteraceae bacterium]|nr:SPOR domain-containing protein [Steroidobacteraceae bacterium]